MNVDTGSFRAITARADAVDTVAAEVARLADRVEGLVKREFAVAAIYEAGQASTGAPVQRRPEGGRHARPRGERPGYLRLVSGSSGGAR
jgi:hypothetical protein